MGAVVPIQTINWKKKMWKLHEGAINFAEWFLPDFMISDRFMHQKRLPLSLPACWIKMMCSHERSFFFLIVLFRTITRPTQIRINILMTESRVGSSRKLLDQSIRLLFLSFLVCLEGAGHISSFGCNHCDEYEHFILFIINKSK